MIRGKDMAISLLAVGSAAVAGYVLRSERTGTCTSRSKADLGARLVGPADVPDDATVVDASARRLGEIPGAHRAQIEPSVTARDEWEHITLESDGAWSVVDRIRQSLPYYDADTGSYNGVYVVDTTIASLFWMRSAGPTSRNRFSNRSRQPGAIPTPSAITVIPDDSLHWADSDWNRSARRVRRRRATDGELAVEFEIVTVRERTRAVDRVETAAVSCVVVDGREDDRLETVAAVREAAPSVPILYVTATPDGTAAAAATRAGATEYFAGATDETLVDRVATLSVDNTDAHRAATGSIRAGPALEPSRRARRQPGARLRGGPPRGCRDPVARDDASPVLL